MLPFKGWAITGVNDVADLPHAYADTSRGPIIPLFSYFPLRKTRVFKPRTVHYN